MREVLDGSLESALTSRSLCGRMSVHVDVSSVDSECVLSLPDVATWNGRLNDVSASYCDIL